MKSSSESSDSLDTARIKDWRSIITLICFFLANAVVLFPFHIPIPVPRALWDAGLSTLANARIIKRRAPFAHEGSNKYIRLTFPMNFVTGPLIAVLFLLAILAIGRQEVRGGTLGADHIAPIDIMVFFLSLAYIAISIDGTGLIRWLSFKVLQKGGGNGRLLFLYLYLFFFALATCVGNDPIVLSGTPFLAYMTRASSNIQTPRAWIFMQFAIANVASAILVSSNPTNLVLAGAFQIRFVDYTVNMIVPVVVTVLFLFPFLLWVVFPSQQYLPSKIELHQLPEDRRSRNSLNPNLPKPSFKGEATPERDHEQFLDSLEEVLNPYLDKKSAIFSSVVMVAVLITILIVNATAPTGKDYPVFWITLPAAAVVFIWDVIIGWSARHEHREIVRRRRTEAASAHEGNVSASRTKLEEHPNSAAQTVVSEKDETSDSNTSIHSTAMPTNVETLDIATAPSSTLNPEHSHSGGKNGSRAMPAASQYRNVATQTPEPTTQETATLQSIAHETFLWLEETFPTTLRTLTSLPLPLVPFALCMFILVQALVTKGWIPVFAYGWDHWVERTGVLGAIGGMAFLSVILCNFAGTNIGTTILLCRMIQAWVVVRDKAGDPISQRTFWATVYSMAIGVNYGAFSIAISGALAGMLWQSILYRKGIVVNGIEFCKVNQPLIFFTMVISCAVLVGEVFLTRGTEPYVPIGD